MVDLGELAAASTFVEMRADSGLRRQVDAAFARAGVARGVAFELATSDAVVRFVRLELADPAARHPISLVHRRPEPSAPSARAFLRLLA